MQTWTDTVYCLNDTQQPHVTLLDNKRVAFHLPGYMLDGRGFSIYLSPAHIEAIADLLFSLETLRTPIHLDQVMTIDLDEETLSTEKTP